MYLDFFQLKEHPFRLTPDPGFLYMGKDHARAKSYMDYSIWNRDGFVVITGEVGAGKTTLIQKLLSEFDDNVMVAKIFQTQLDDVEFLQAVLVEFGLNPFQARKAELMDMLSTFLIESFLESKQLVLIVDEAQNLSMRVLEEIRMLSGLETHKEKVLHIILVGQPQLNAILDAPEMEQLIQRVRFRFHIRALTLVETKAYIDHRLQVAGLGGNSLFSEEAIAIVFEHTGGIPRLINTLCDTAMTCAFADDVTTVSADTLRAAVQELQWPPYAQRRHESSNNAALAKAPAQLRTGNNEGLAPLINVLSEKLTSIEHLLQGIAQQLAQTQGATAARARPKARR